MANCINCPEPLHPAYCLADNCNIVWRYCAVRHNCTYRVPNTTPCSHGELIRCNDCLHWKFVLFGECDECEICRDDDTTGDIGDSFEFPQEVIETVDSIYSVQLMLFICLVFVGMVYFFYRVLEWFLG
jgi:hypothetical protein